MKVVDKQLLFISSHERGSGSISDFHITLPSHLLVCQPYQRLRVILNDIVLPYTWYNVQEGNRQFKLLVGLVTLTITLNTGSYHAMQLRSHLQERLNYYSSQAGFASSAQSASSSGCHSC